MAQNQYTFDSSAYLAANPDVARAIGQPGVGSAWEHYNQFGKNEGRQAVFGEPTVTDPSQWEATPTNLNPSTGEYENTFYRDPATGNLYSSNEANANLVAQGKAINDPYLQLFNPEEANALYNLKDTNPNQYYEKVANKLGDAIYSNYGSNTNYDALYNQLQGIKEVDPKAYYQNQLEFLGQQAGWQIGQNRNDRTGPVYEQINALIPEAQAAGLSADKINSLVGTSINEANAANQQRIVNSQASGGNFWKENLIGAAKVGALALGAYGLDTALTAGAGAGLTASQAPNLASGLQVGTGSALAGTGAGAAAVPAGGAVSSLGSLAWAPPAIGGSAGFLAPTLGADIASTGFGLTAADIPSLITGLELGASQGMTLSEALSYANKAKQGLSAANKVLNIAGGKSGSGSATPRASGANSGADLSKLASALAGSSFTPMNVAQIQSRNPFLFDVPGQTTASEGMYDVSGSNLAKALRKA